MSRRQESPTGSASARPASTQDAFRKYSGKVSRQAAVFLLGTLFSVVVGYLFKAYLGRVLGAPALGLYALGLHTVGGLVLLASLGLPSVLARYVALYKSLGQGLNSGQGLDADQRLRPLLRQSVVLVLALSVSLAIVFFWGRHWVAQGLFATPGLVRYLPLFALLLPLSALNQLYGQYLRGHQEVTQRTLISHFVQLPVKIVATLALIAWGLGLSGYIVAELISQAVAVVLLFTLARRLTPSSPPGTRGLDGENLAYGRQMLGLNGLRFLSQRLDILLLGALATIDQVGIYSMAVATAAFVPTLLRALNSIFGPVISDLHARGEMALLARLFKSTSRWCLGLTAPLVLVICLYAPTLMSLFGEPFRAGQWALIWLVIGQLLHVASGPVGNLLVMSGYQQLELWSSLLTAVLTTALSLWLIPGHGMAGAALAVGIGLGASNALRLILVWRALGLQPYDRRSLKFLLPLAAATACVVAVATLSPLDPDGTSWWGLGLALVGGYLAWGLTVMPLLDAEDRVLLRGLIERRPR